MCVRVQEQAADNQSWPKPYMHTVHDRAYGGFSVQFTLRTYTVYSCIITVPANRIHVLYHVQGLC